MPKLVSIPGLSDSKTHVPRSQPACLPPVFCFSLALGFCLDRDQCRCREKEQQGPVVVGNANAERLKKTHAGGKRRTSLVRTWTRSCHGFSAALSWSWKPSSQPHNRHRGKVYLISSLNSCLSPGQPMGTWHLLGFNRKARLPSLSPPMAYTQQKAEED